MSPLSAMNIYGVDFTSVPSPKKPITLAEGTLEEDILNIFAIKPLNDFKAFEDLLEIDGEWVAGIDFPFGLPRKLVTDLGWPQSWQDYVAKIARMKKEEFGDLLRGYRALRGKGDKQPRRETDKWANSRSPMMWYGIPVGKMLFEGAPRLLRSKACVLPFREPRPGCGIIVEAYPALVARKMICTRSYKSDDRKKQTEHRKAARDEITQSLSSSALRERYGFRVRLTDLWAHRLIQDVTGDYLDAVLCAVQAAWAYSQRDHNFGIAHACDRLEGWIVDPDTLPDSRPESSQ